jgi:2-methylcitrate dehydratase PrpD
MQHAPAVTQILARFAVEARWDDVPHAARHEAKRALMNFFAVALAGCRAPAIEIVLKSLAEFSDRKQATVNAWMC